MAPPFRVRAPACDFPSQDSLFRVRGRVTACLELEQIQLECGEAPSLHVESLTDEAFGLELCRSRAVLQMPDSIDSRMVSNL